MVHQTTRALPSSRHMRACWDRYRWPMSLTSRPPTGASSARWMIPPSATRPTTSSGREAELAAILAAELGDAVVAHLVSDGGDAAAGHQQESGLLQSDLLLELDRTFAGDDPKSTVERGGTEAAVPGKIFDPKLATNWKRFTSPAVARV